MIVASVLLILVAVVLLALGLAGDSSGLLIASIVASLLAAVALVIGARQAAAARRAAEPQQPETPLGMPQQSAPGGRRRDPHDPVAPPYADDSAPAQTAFAAESGTSPRDADLVADTPPSADSTEATSSRAPAGEPFFADQAGAAPAERPTAPTDPVTVPPAAAMPAATTPATAPVPGSARLRDVSDDPEMSAAEARVAGARDAAQAGDRNRAEHVDADYQRASSTIGAARNVAAEDPGWGRQSASDAALTDEFAEPDADDPDDEPLPQAVRPTDAVLVARLDSEVLVVDGRPRYHLADCPHLVGRLTEPLPAAEAVELGFSPCGLCRPVDRLVAATLRH